jgi:hypothetical protein
LPIGSARSCTRYSAQTVSPRMMSFRSSWSV